MTDPYKVLGVSRDASDDEVKKGRMIMRVCGKSLQEDFSMD